MIENETLHNQTSRNRNNGTGNTVRRSRRLLLCGAIALAGLGVSGVALAGSASAAAPATKPATVRSAVADNTTDDTTTDDTTTDDTTTDDTTTDDTTTDGEYEEYDDEGWDDYDDSDWVAEYNAEQDQLAAYLDEQGITYTIEDDGESHWVVVDYEDQAASDAVDDFYWSLYPATPEEIADYNAGTNALVAFFQERGIEVTVTTDRHGYRDAEWDYDDEAASAAYDDYWWEQDPISAEDIAAMNADTEAQVTYLTEQGFEASIETDEHGIETAVFDEDDDAVWAALDSFWENQYGGACG